MNFLKKTLSLSIVIGYEVIWVKLKPPLAMAQYFHECRMNLIRQTKRLHPPELSDHTLNRLYWHHNQRVMKPSKWLTACQRDLPSPGDIQLKAFLAPNSKQLMTFVQRFAPKKLINCGENQLESCEAETSRNYSVDRPVKIPDQSVITCVQITVGECLSAEQLRTECCQFFLRIFSLNWSADMQNSGWRPLTANKIPTRPPCYLVSMRWKPIDSPWTALHFCYSVRECKFKCSAGNSRKLRKLAPSFAENRWFWGVLNANGSSNCIGLKRFKIERLKSYRLLPSLVEFYHK